MQRGQVLLEALEVINSRQDLYGKLENNFSLIARFWSAYLGVLVTAKDVAIMMSLLKVAREKSGVGKRDNFVDLCGYAALASEMSCDEEN